MIHLTGLSEFTIRGWENRYSVFRPQRGETGRREYSTADVERALLLRELIKRGHKIGKVSALSNQKLKGLFEHPEEPVHAPVDHRKKNIAEIMELVSLQKWPELQEALRKIPTKNVGRLLHDFLLPLMGALAADVEAGVVSVAQEHILSACLKEKIYVAVSEQESKKRTGKVPKGVQFILAAPEGDYHEIGLLLAHMLIRSSGFVSLYLGPNTPAQDLAETALRFGASHLLVVTTVSKKGGARQEPLSYISEVQKKMGAHLKILVAGTQAPIIPHESDSSLFALKNFEELEGYLKNLGGRL